MTEKDDLHRVGNLEIEYAVKGCKITVYGKKAVLTEGHKGIKRFSCDEASFKTAESDLYIIGKALRLSHISRGVALIEGEITSVEYGE